MQNAAKANITIPPIAQGRTMARVLTCDVDNDDDIGVDVDIDIDVGA